MSNQKTQYVKDLANRKITATRSFNAPLYMVWKAWTDEDILDQWWAPKPYMSRTKVMDFKPGGRRFYAMVSPEGMENWQIQQYTSISPKTNLKSLCEMMVKEDLRRNKEGFIF